jgi:HK97 family phage portal protein
LKPRTSAGIAVDEQSIFQVPAAHAAIAGIADTAACLPLELKRRLPDGGSELATYHDLFFLLRDEPNSEMTTAAFVTWMLVNYKVFGEFFIEIQRDGQNQVTALNVLPTKEMHVGRKPDGSLVYVQKHQGKDIPFDPSEIIHVYGLTIDGTTAISPLDVAGETIGHALAAARFGASFLANGARPSVALTYPGILSDQARKNLGDSFKDNYGGSENVGKVPVLEEGADLKTFNVTPEEGQYVETCDHLTRDLARHFQVSPTKIGDLSNATFSNVESEAISYVVHTIKPALIRIEQEFNRKLLSKEERGQFYIRFNLDEMLRGDTAERYASYNMASGSTPWLTVNEIRAMEGRAKYPGGDVLPRPLNMGDVNNAPNGTPVDPGTSQAGNDQQPSATDQPEQTGGTGSTV